MAAPIAKRISWFALGLFAAVAGAGMVFAPLNHDVGEVLENAFFVVVFVAIGAVGALVSSRQPRNAIGWLFLSSACLAAIGFLAEGWATYTLVTRPGSLPGGVWSEWLSNQLWIPVLFPLLTFVPLLFPDGRLPSRRWRPVAWVAGVGMGLGVISTAVRPGPFEDGDPPIENPLGVEGAGGILNLIDTILFPAVVLAAILSVVGLILRYRRSAGEERQRFKWFVYGLGVFAASFLVSLVFEDILDTTTLVATIAFDLGFIAVPVGAGIAILRHRLFDVDVVINRTIVVAVLAGFVTVVYVALVVGIGALLAGTRANTFLTILAAVVIAVAFQPARARAQHLANRLVFGKRATPYEVLSEFAGRIGGGFGAEDLLPRMARAVGEGIGASVALVWLKVGRQLRVAGAWPAQAVPPLPLALESDEESDEVPPIPDADKVYPVRHEGELLGALSVTKPRGEPLTGTEDQLIEGLASQAGLVLRNVRLTEQLRANLEELRASRQRIVAAQDEERRRLERNIHDGAQQQLVAMALKVRIARDLRRKDPDRAEAILGELERDAQDAVDTLRDLARGIYPPLLADQGLAAALSAQARKAAIPVTVETDGIGRYPQDVEAAAYFCCLEALQNSAKYGGGAPAVVRLSEGDGMLRFRVADQGPGFDAERVAYGSGLQNMRDRLDALGGTLRVTSRPGAGTVVAGQIPVRT